MCDATSGKVLFKWRAHSSEVKSVAVRGEDWMIVSGSFDGTIARWDSTNGRQIGTRFVVGYEANMVRVSRYGKRIAFASRKKAGILDAEGNYFVNAAHDGLVRSFRFGRRDR